MSKVWANRLIKGLLSRLLSWIVCLTTNAHKNKRNLTGETQAKTIFQPDRPQSFIFIYQKTKKPTLDRIKDEDRFYPGRQRRSASLSPELFKLGIKNSRFDLKALSKDDSLLNSTVSLCCSMFCVRINFLIPIFYLSFLKCSFLGMLFWPIVGIPNFSHADAFQAIKKNIKPKSFWKAFN